MTLIGWAQIILFFAIVLATTKPLGVYMAHVFSGEHTWLDPVMGPVERLVYRLSGVNAKREMRWTEYALAILAFSAFNVILLYTIQRLQGVLPLNPYHRTAVDPALAFNTAASFVTNTNWQDYGGESTMSYFTQMVGLTFQNFVSPVVGMAVAVAFIRAFARQGVDELGNFWVDLTRASLYVMLPICIPAALILVSQGVIQNFNPYTVVHTVAGGLQTIAQGPVASQEAIKMFGTNGGGFFNANSAHPFENPTPFSNLFEIWLIIAIPAALTYTFGRMVKNQRAGWAIFGAMAFLFIVGTVAVYGAEAQGNPAFGHLGLHQAPAALWSHGNMEGKETRFGIAGSAIFANTTTAVACGAINSWFDSYTPLGGMVPLANMLTGEVIFGGDGSGLYAMLIIAIITVFIAGLMVGRTPEYLGKKIQARDVKLAMLALLYFPLSILAFTAVSVVIKAGTGPIFNPGPHGFSEVLYAFTSTNANNGSAFGGLGTNTPYYNVTLGLAMLIGRYIALIPTLAVAGALVQKKIVPPSAGTLPVGKPLFSGLLVGVIVIVGALNFFPALSLGPILEHLQLYGGHLY